MSTGRMPGQVRVESRGLLLRPRVVSSRDRSGRNARLRDGQSSNLRVFIVVQFRAQEPGRLEHSLGVGPFLEIFPGDVALVEKRHLASPVTVVPGIPAHESVEAIDDDVLDADEVDLEAARLRARTRDSGAASECCSPAKR